ncbi:MAG: hel [Acidobacteria bacterium]|nr:hel [Acidobacteriota bacterium]
MKRILALLLLSTAAAYAQAPAAKTSLEIKYVRDSAEYAALSREVYRIATDAALAKGKAAKGAWGVILDVDETVLDNSTYQLERVTYTVPFEDVSWLAWINRAEAGSVPGVADFLTAIRAAGGKVAFITNRDEKAREGTQRNLERNGLWSSNDVLCLLADNYPKSARRKEVADGSGKCSWSGVKVGVVAFVGDQMGDFPQTGEPFDGAGADAQFGRSFFLLPNPMYGGWVTSVTRK